MCLIAVYVFRNKNKLINETTVAVCLFVVLCVVYKYHDILLRLFDGIIQRGFDDSGRFIYYKDGLKKFLQHPLLGMGFGNSHGVNDKFIIPAPEYFHNTIVQVLASCGIVGMVAYMVHRVETIVLFFKNRSYASFFMGMSILNLLLTSLLDIHMFNIFPAMFYSVILCFFEQHTKTETLN
jgi:O-antigen ligase